MKVQKKTEVWLVKKRLPRPIDVVQYDKGIQLVFEVQDFTIPDGTTATLYVQKPSGKFVYQETGITVAGNTITIDLENQAITEHGNDVPYQVQLTNGADVITTFAGIMRVERSLKDAGAEESESVIAAFEAKTAEQIAQIEAAAQAQIEVIQILYTTYATKTEAANAVKGKLSGAVVAADDVSPLEHNPVVWVHGKNLFNGELLSGVFLSNSFSLDAENGLVFKSIKAHLRPGTYTVSFGKKVNIVRSIIDGAYAIVGYVGVTQHTFAVTTAGYVGFTFRDSTSITTEWDDSVAVQIEVGTTATDHEPYIDPSTVTVKRCGKNLYDNSTIADKYVETSGYRKYKLLIPNGEYRWSLRENTFFGSGCYAIWTDDEAYSGSDHTDNCFYNWIGNSGVERECPIEGGFTASKGYVYLATTGAVNGIITEFIEKFETMQLEVGSVATAFEPYNGAEYTPAADGTVSGVTSLSPNMTILTDTEGVIVECEYNRDTNKAIENAGGAVSEEDIASAVEAYMEEHPIDVVSDEQIASAVEGYMEENPVDVPVISVNGKTGTVVLTASDVGALPSNTQIPSVPSTLPNPNKLTFTGAVSAEYDGSAAVSVEIPEGGGGGYSVETVPAESVNIWTIEDGWRYIFFVDSGTATANILVSSSGYKTISTRVAYVVESFGDYIVLSVGRSGSDSLLVRDVKNWQETGVEDHEIYFTPTDVTNFVVIKQYMGGANNV